MTIYEAISLITSLLAIWISIRTNRLKIHPSKLAEKQLSNLIKDETVPKLALDVEHSSYDEYQKIIIENTGDVEAHNICIRFNPPINFRKYDKEKFDKQFPYKILCPGNKIYLEYQYHTYGKRDHFEIEVEWSNKDGQLQNKVFYLQQPSY